MNQPRCIRVMAQAYGEGTEHHLLKPTIEVIQERLNRLDIDDDVFASGAVFTADTGYYSEANINYLFDNNIDACVPDGKFRSRDERFRDQKEKYGSNSKPKQSGAEIDTIKKTCICPMGNGLSNKSESIDKYGDLRLRFKGKVTNCRSYSRLNECMRNPESVFKKNGNGRQVSVVVKKNSAIRAIDLMKQKIDSDIGRLQYSLRMSVITCKEGF